MTKIEIINETIEYYSENPTKRRALDSKGECQYSFRGKTCAVGRCLINPKEIQGIMRKQKNRSTDVYALVDVCIDLANQYRKKKIKLFSYDSPSSSSMIPFQKKYKGHEALFWSDLQQFHDSDGNWSERGLTVQGRTYADMMLDRWKD